MQASYQVADQVLIGQHFGMPAATKAAGTSLLAIIQVLTICWMHDGQQHQGATYAITKLLQLRGHVFGYKHIAAMCCLSTCCFSQLVAGEARGRRVHNICPKAHGAAQPLHHSML